MDWYPPHLRSHFIPSQLQSLTASPQYPIYSTKQQCRILLVLQGMVLVAGLAGRTSSRVSHWNGWTSISSPKSLPNDNNTRLTISRSLHTYQGASSCLQHCLRSARYLPDFQFLFLSSPSQSLSHHLPTLQNQRILFPLLFLGPIPTHTACFYPRLCVSCCGHCRKEWSLAEKDTEKCPPPFHLYTDF